MNLGRRLGTRYLAREGAPTVTGLNTVEGAVFALMGLVLAFAISGALQRFDERKLLILHEANAISTAYDRLGLLENPARLELQSALKAYLHARIDFYEHWISFSLWQGAEVDLGDHLAQLAKLKTEIWDGAVTACAGNKPGCILILPSLNSMFENARMRDHQRGDTLRTRSMSCFSARPRRITACRLRHGGNKNPQLVPYGDLCGGALRRAVRRHRPRISSARPHPRQ
jgi:hypothetical protein